MTTFTNFTEEMTTKKATVKISQKNKFLRDQKSNKLGNTLFFYPQLLFILNGWQNDTWLWLMARRQPELIEKCFLQNGCAWQSN